MKLNIDTHEQLTPLLRDDPFLPLLHLLKALGHRITELFQQVAEEECPGLPTCVLWRCHPPVANLLWSSIHYLVVMKSIFDKAEPMARGAIFMQNADCHLFKCRLEMVVQDLLIHSKGEWESRHLHHTPASPMPWYMQGTLQCEQVTCRWRVYTSSAPDFLLDCCQLL